MKVIIHNESAVEPAVEEIEEAAGVTEVIRITGVPEAEEAELSVWLEEAEDPLGADTPLAEQGVGEGSQITIARKVKVEVTVHFGGKAISHSFAPNQKVKSVLKWACGEKGFDLGADQRPEHELALVGHEEAAEPKAPISAYADRHHKVEFDLRRKDGYQG